MFLGFQGSSMKSVLTYLNFGMTDAAAALGTAKSAMWRQLAFHVPRWHRNLTN